MRKSNPKRETYSLGPRFWEIINARTDNPFVDRGKVTREGLKHLERLERRKQGKMTREDLLYFLKGKR